MTNVDHSGDWGCLAKTYKRGEYNPAHSHDRGQLLFAEKGVMLVDSGEKQWIIPPQRALWLPAGEVHAFNLLSQTDLRTVYFSRDFIRAACDGRVLEHIHVIEVTPFVRQIIGQLFENRFNQETQKLMAQVLLRILNETEALPVDLPMPRDEKLHRIALDILINNDWDASLSQLAARAAMSERTFTRFFTADTGYSFRTWKQRARVFASFDMLSDGIPVKQIAYQLGFSCPASFISSFRTITGRTPATFTMRVDDKLTDVPEGRLEAFRDPADKEQPL